MKVVGEAGVRAPFASMNASGDQTKRRTLAWLVAALAVTGVLWRGAQTYLRNIGAIVEPQDRTDGVLITICLEVDECRRRVGATPTTIPSRGDGGVFMDGWGHPFVLGPSDEHLQIMSLGPDGLRGSQDDRVATYMRRPDGRHVCVLPGGETQTFDFRAP